MQVVHSLPPPSSRTRFQSVAGRPCGGQGPRVLPHLAAQKAELSSCCQTHEQSSRYQARASTSGILAPGGQGDHLSQGRPAKSSCPLTRVTPADQASGRSEASPSREPSTAELWASSAGPAVFLEHIQEAHGAELPGGVCVRTDVATH